MATAKRFYWMKLKESFMTSDTIDYFMSQPDGANYVVLYQMLCLKTINTDGRLSRQIGEVVIKYDIPKIQRDLKWFSADTIRVALNLYTNSSRLCCVRHVQRNILHSENHTELYLQIQLSFAPYLSSKDPYMKRFQTVTALISFLMSLHQFLCLVDRLL